MSPASDPQGITGGLTLYLLPHSLRNYEKLRQLIGAVVRNRAQPFKQWLISKYNAKHADNMYRYATKYHTLAFSQELMQMPATRKKLGIMQSISLLTRYIKITTGINLHRVWLEWLKEKEVCWSHPQPKLQTQAKEFTLTNIPVRYHDFVLFMYVTGLRTLESIKAYNDHDKYCKDGILELYWNSGNRKLANATYCLCSIKPRPWSLLAITPPMVKRNVNTKTLNFEPRYLRHLNFTVNANKVNPLLAEFTQGRRGSISEKHYYISLLSEYKQKWIDVWKPVIEMIIH